MGAPPDPPTEPHVELLLRQDAGFVQRIYLACFSLAGSQNTRLAYWGDARHWLDFCQQRGQDPAQPQPVAVIAWDQEMTQLGLAPKTRARRLAAMSSIYNHLARTGDVPSNPFAADIGPRRQRAVAERPTPMAVPESVRAVLATCSQSSVDGIRDEAIIRILWGTGLRRASLLAMTSDRLQRDGTEYVARLPAKGGKEVKILIHGRAAEALSRWLVCLEQAGLSRGPIWLSETGEPLSPKSIWRMLQARAKQAGVTSRLSPHTFRVAFLTLNPATLDARQDAVGHADPTTTRAYDRKWRGREAFEAMPEIEDA